MAEPDTPRAAPRRQYRKPALRSFGGLAELTRMAVGMMGMPDGGGPPPPNAPRRTGL